MVQYLTRNLSSWEVDALESHYLGCRECYEELRATELLIFALGQIVIDRTRANDVAIVRFGQKAELTRSSLELHALLNIVRVQNETKVLIDLSNVSRIDSAGLGMLMNCYTHAVKNQGVLKLLNPNDQVKRVLNIAKLDDVLPSLEDEESAIESFS